MCTLNPFGLAPYIKLLGKKVNMCAECIHLVIAFKLKPQNYWKFILNCKNVQISNGSCSNNFLLFSVYTIFN